MPTRCPAGRRLAESDEPRGDVHHLTEVPALDQAVALKHRAMGIVGAGQRRGMRGSRTGPRLGLPDLVDDDRHACLQRLLSDTPEGIGVLHVLDQHEQRAHFAFVEYEVGKVERLQAGLVARGDDVADGHLARSRVVEEREADAATLSDDGHLATFPPNGQKRPIARLDSRAEGGAEAEAVLAKPSELGPITAMP